MATNPTNPAQICSVANGMGEVSTEAVTDVAVTCTDAPEANVSKVAAEGETLPDNTVLTHILLDGGVAINLSGEVAFGGRDDAVTDAAFTQDGLVVAEGDTLPDGTVVDEINVNGGVAIN